MIYAFTIVFFIFGLIIGSFLNVVIYRYNTARSFGGRSLCLSCNKELSWYDLVPLISFFALRGRCRNCKSKFSWQYPLVELSTGVLFALLFSKFSAVFFAGTFAFAILYAYYAVMFSLLLVIAVYDLRHKIIPDILSLSFGGLAFLGMFLFLDSSFFIHFPGVREILSGIILAAPFALLWLISRGKWMGLGDAKLILGLGWLLGFPMALSALLIAFWGGALLGVALLIISRRYSLKSELPFGPFLVLASFIAFIGGIVILPIPF